MAIPQDSNPIEVHPDLMDAVVTRALRGQMSSSYWRRRGNAYTAADHDNRFAALDELNREFFVGLGFLDVFIETSKEMLADTQPLPLLRVALAYASGHEGAELYVRGESRTVILRIRSDRFENTPELVHFLRREFLHVADMHDPAFGYCPDLALPADLAWMKKAVLERYRALWDTVVDGRLARGRIAPDDAHSRRWRDFQRSFSILGAECVAAFEWWFNHSSPTHESMSDFARSPVEFWHSQMHTTRESQDHLAVSNE